MNPRDRIVSEIAQTRILTMDASDTLDLDEVLRLTWVRDIPVLDGERMVGVVSARDLLRAFLLQATRPGRPDGEPTAMRVGDVMTRKVVTIDFDATLGEAAELMQKNRIAFLPMVDTSGTPRGYVTETDLVRATLL